ncbi:SdiA-regulated domain-containing protein [Mucilaginibacter flavidus]|uniref:SdiA-regulated domain-containing protein n=1 Tax=Mucilaginibacter flavidus TaxID=2949309 RepID=UPI00209292D1|nr:SdiA-regulated domain-containing protein [Mucilaginibacter flavidus]MCO5946819.1 SdiA-regulated domain-containing protein [Mucilaginibacter flavidus]
MKNTLMPGYLCLLLLTCALLINCTGQQQSKSPGPKGYDLTRPVKYELPDELTEISGIAFNKGNADTMYAEQDEKGSLFYFKPGNKDMLRYKFGKSGDYEDVAINNGQVIMLRSDGVLFTFPLQSVKSNRPADARAWEGLLPQGEYEGMFADDSTQSVYVLCKHCSIEKSSKTSTVFTLKLAADGTLTSAEQSVIDVKKIEKLTGQKKITFHPSGLSRSPLTGDWYILSSVNKMLIVAGANWEIKEVHPLNPQVFGQPEGIAFDKDNNLYISNEGDKLRMGNVLKFAFKK